MSRWLMPIVFNVIFRFGCSSANLFHCSISSFESIVFPITNSRARSFWNQSFKFPSLIMAMLVSSSWMYKNLNCFSWPNSPNNSNHHVKLIKLNGFLTQTVSKEQCRVVMLYWPVNITCTIYTFSESLLRADHETVIDSVVSLFWKKFETFFLLFSNHF